MKTYALIIKTVLLLLLAGNNCLLAQKDSLPSLKKATNFVEIKSYYSLWHSLEVSLFEDRTPREKFGMAVEIPFKENKLIEIGGSFNNTAYSANSLIENKIGQSGIYDYEYQIKNQILNVALKKYSVPSPHGWSHSFGIYLRYWHHRYKRINTDKYPAEYVQYLNRYPHVINEHIHKISAGFIVELKKQIGNSPISMGLNIGAGTSLHGGYIIKEDYWADTYDKTYVESTLPLWLSLRSEFSIAYRF